MDAYVVAQIELVSDSDEGIVLLAMHKQSGVIVAFVYIVPEESFVGAKYPRRE